MVISDWIWISGLVVLGSLVFVFAFRIFVMRYFFENRGYEHYYAKMLEIQERLLREYGRGLEIHGGQFRAEHERFADMVREQHYRTMEHLGDIVKELNRGLRDQYEHLSRRETEVSQVFEQALHERLRDVGYIRDRGEELTRALADQREQLERLSAELAASKEQQRKFEEAFAGVISQSETGETRRGDLVWFTAYAPRIVAPKATFLLDIWAHCGAVSCRSGNCPRTRTTQESRCEGWYRSASWNDRGD